MKLFIDNFSLFCKDTPELYTVQYCVQVGQSHESQHISHTAMTAIKVGYFSPTGSYLQDLQNARMHNYA